MIFNESVKKMTLNADNRTRFKNVILRDAFEARTADIYTRFYNLINEMAKLTWGASPQARAANMKRFKDLVKKQKDLRDIGFRLNKIDLEYFDQQYLMIVIGGQRYNACVTKEPETIVREFDTMFLTHAFAGKTTDRRVSSPTGTIHLREDHPLAKEWHGLRQEVEDMVDAKDELAAIINTVFGKSRTLGSALERWPGLEVYVPKILSSSREIMVTGPVIDKRLKALREAKMPAKKAMQIGRSQTT